MLFTRMGATADWTPKPLATSKSYQIPCSISYFS